MKIKYAAFISFLVLNYLQSNAFAQIKFNNQENINAILENNKKDKYFSNNKYSQIEINKFIYLLANNIETYPQNINDLNSFQIISDKQFRTEENFIAKGNVIIQNGSSILVADELEYNSKLSVISLIGNIKFIGGEQFFEASEFQFDLKNKIGLIKNVYGSINFDSLESLKLSRKIDNEINEELFKDKEIKNVILNSTSTLGFRGLDLKEEGSFVNKVSSQKFILDLNESQEWRFKTDKIEINDNEWFAEKLILTNDPFNNPQLVIHNKGFRSISSDGEITIKSNWSTIILDDKLSIPTGPRRYKIDEDYLFRWGIGYDKDTKDGLFITRNFDPIYFGKDKKTRLNIKKEFYLQRILNGKTKSFSKKNESLLATKSERDTEFSDYFGLEGDFKTSFSNFKFNSNFTLNSLELSKFKKSFTNKSELSTIIYSENKPNSKKETKVSIFGNYRNKVWNGSLGEREIISAYGLNLSKTRTWTKKNVAMFSNIAASYGDYQSSDKDDTLRIINRERLNIFLDRSHSYPLWRPKKSIFIDKKNIFSPLVIQSGLNLNAQAKIDLYRYSDNNYQNLFIIKTGPELILGNFEKKLFDFTKISIYKKTTLASGKSPFGFDQSTDNNTIEFNFKQQLLGPLTIDYKTEYNLDINSPNYKKFFNNQYELTWNRRAYSIGLYYNHETKSGGLNFKINSFKFDGYGEKF